MTKQETITYFEELQRRFLELKSKSENLFEQMHYETTLSAVDQALGALKTSEPLKAKWISCECGCGITHCSHCNSCAGLNYNGEYVRSPYCSVCGALMLED